MADPVKLHRYPEVDAALLSEHEPLVGQKVHGACRLPSGRVLSVHSVARPRHGGGSAFRVPTIALWREGACERLLQGFGDIGYFEYSHTNSSVDLADVAELADGSIVALRWGEKDSDGLFRLIHDTVLWEPDIEQAEHLPSTAWCDDGFELLLWTCRQVGGAGYDAERDTYAPDKVIRRLRLHP